MKQDMHLQGRELSPHLAAAALWLSKRVRTPNPSKIGNRDLRNPGSTPDDLIAL